MFAESFTPGCYMYENKYLNFLKSISLMDIITLKSLNYEIIYTYKDIFHNYNIFSAAINNLLITTEENFSLSCTTINSLKYKFYEAVLVPHSPRKNVCERRINNGKISPRMRKYNARQIYTTHRKVYCLLILEGDFVYEHNPIM